PSNPPLRPPFPTGDPAPPQSPLDPWIGGFLSHTPLETAPPVSQQLVPLMVTNTATVPAHLYTKQDEDQLYIKKPPNAFMIYLKEQRPKVMAELNLTGSAAINAVVGKRWRSLSKAQQAKYFDQAETERCRHATEHPDWSTKENYVCPKWQKRTRTRNRTSSTGERRFLGMTTF
uniref:HMG box domain-containing protein n=1 Tax=Oreochromis aureus TaxID=47969 RepID=A0AAZ1X950_OREAU